MKNTFLPFTTALLGSMPRSKELLQARRKYLAGLLSKDEYMNLVLEENKKVIDIQRDNGIELITSGELTRDNYVSFVAEKLSGVTMMSMADMLDYIDDKQAFEQILETLDVPAISIKNAICNGRIARSESLLKEELERVKSLTTLPIKATLPGPYLMTRSMWLPNLSGKYYSSKEELGKDVIAILKEEIDELEALGVKVIQFDEPVLTEVVFTEGKTRSFMCAALSEKKDPTQELEFATSLIKELMDYMRDKEMLSSLHVCRGNWSKNEGILLKGSYTPLLKLFEEVLPDILTLEFSTPRAGELSSLLESTKIRENCILGLGVINPRTDMVQSSESIIERAKEALEYLPKERLWLNPDCGFATFANRPVNTMLGIEKKLKELNKAKEYLRAEYE